MDSTTNSDKEKAVQGDDCNSTHSTNNMISAEIKFRQVAPAEISACFEIEKASYPKDEAASKSVLQYRQHFAGKYFRCAVIVSEDDEDHHDVEQIVGFICATRCRVFTEKSMDTHDSTGPLLAIHSVVVDKRYRGRGIATAMLRNYIENMMSSSMATDGVQRFVLLAKVHLLAFYLKAGFSVLRLSDIVHGQEPWYHLERRKEVSALSWVVDAFTTTPGQGNPAAVVLIETKGGFKSGDETQTKWCQTIAQEFNLSETAFVWKIVNRDCKNGGSDEQKNKELASKQGQHDESENNTRGKRARKNRTNQKSTPAVEKTYYGIRYFTSNGTEVDLCGHASLAAAAVLFQETSVPELIFCAKHDELIMTPCKYWNCRRMQICMKFPNKSLTEITDTGKKEAVVEMLQKAFSKLKNLSETEIIYAGIDEDGNDLLVEVAPDIMNAIGYDSISHSAFLDWDGYQRGVIICSVSPPVSTQNQNDTKPDVVSRFFGPKVGINEDPVTGSAHCVIAPYFAKKLDKTTILADQISQRGGRILCTVQEDYVKLKGSAVITLNGNSWIR